jgi:hypothetical protein
LKPATAPSIALPPTIFIRASAIQLVGISVSGTNLPIRNVRYMAAFGGDPDIEPTAPNDQVWTHCDHGLDSNLTAQQRSCRPSWRAIIGL